MQFKVLEEMFKGENPESIFEIGCGGAGLLKDVSDHYGGIRVGGIDTSKVRMENSKNLFPDIQFIVHDLNDPWPVPDNSFDIVFSVCTLGYIFNPFPVVQEMFRVARDKVILAEYHSNNTDEYGFLLKAIMPDRTETLIARDYRKLLKDKNLQFFNSESGKTIIKCRK